MTIIVAARTSHRIGRRTKEAITVACDTLILGGWEKMSGATPKLWQEDGRFLVGAAGLVAACQGVRYHVTWPHYAPSQSLEAWLVKEVVPLVSCALSNAELLERRRGVMDFGINMLVATGTELALIDAAGGVVIPRITRGAVGSGYAEALGSLGDGPWTEDDVIRAAYAATNTNVGCGPPIYYANTLDYEIHEADLSALTG